MKIGIALPQMGSQISPAFLIRLAQEAEQLGYASLWVGERLLRPRRYVPFGYPPTAMPDYFKNIFDPLETLAYVAAVTRRINLGASVIVPFWHVPVVLARRLATLDHFSGGRLLVGLGQGWLEEEFQAANVPLRRRGSGLEDYLGALRACWGPDPVSYNGRWYRIAESDIGPKPLQPAGPPVLFGVGSPAALRRAARLADGINPIVINWKGLESLLNTYRTLVREAGRDPQQLLIVVRSNGVMSLSAPLPEPRLPLSGSLEQLRQDILRLAELGVRHIFFDPAASSFTERELLELLPRLFRIAAGG